METDLKRESDRTRSKATEKIGGKVKGAGHAISETEGARKVGLKK